MMITGGRTKYSLHWHPVEMKQGHIVLGKAKRAENYNNGNYYSTSESQPLSCLHLTTRYSSCQVNIKTIHQNYCLFLASIFEENVKLKALQ